MKEQVNKSTSVPAADEKRTLQTLTDEELALISSTAAKEAIKESIAYLSESSFRQLIQENNVEVINAFQKVLANHEKEKQRSEREKRRRMLKNTELLIVNYRKCKKMVSEIDMEKYTDEGTFLSSEELTLETLEKYRMKTYKMIRHIDMMLAAYEFESKRGTMEEQRRFTVLKKRYIDEQRMSVKQIMTYLHIGQSTVYGDTKKAVEDMASLIFGYDAVMFS